MGAPTAAQVFAGYQLHEVLGRGGMGVVYRATQLGLDRQVALKLILPEYAGDPHFRERFERESKVAASIEHPHVIPVYEAGEVDGQVFIAMRFIEGLDLRQLLHRDGGRLEPVRAAKLISQVGAALDAAHSAGLVHRDVKPANVLIEGWISDEHAYLTDFGLTKRMASDTGLTQTGQWVGTLDYVAPEQVRGDAVDARTDVYALGCVLYQTLTGQVPYPKDSDVAKLWAHVNDPPPLATAVAPDLPPAFDSVIERAMATDPADRYRSTGDLGKAAEGRLITGGERTVARGEAAPKRRRPRRRVPIIGAVLLLVLAAAGAGYFLSGRSGNSEGGTQSNAANPNPNVPKEGLRPSYLSDRDMDLLRKAKVPVMLPPKPPPDWQLPGKAKLVSATEAQEEFAPPEGSWSVDFTNEETAAANFEMFGGSVSGTFPDVTPDPGDTSGNCNAPGGECAVFHVRGIPVNRSIGASGDSFYWTECGTRFSLSWISKATREDIRRLIESFQVVDGHSCRGHR